MTTTMTQPVLTHAGLAPEPLVAVEELQQSYGTEAGLVHALKGVTFAVHPGDYVAIMGPSGSGKSTLMNILGCLDVPSAGRYLLDGRAVDGLSEDELAEVRNRKIGFVFQQFNLIPRMTASANVQLPLVYAGVPARQRRSRAEEALARVGLAERADHLPNALSGGQQQRVAIARALVTEPSIILADEPTGNLDNASTADVLEVFDEVAAAGRTIVMITHEDDVAERADRILRIADGLLVADTVTERGRTRRAPAATGRDQGGAR